MDEHSYSSRLLCGGGFDAQTRPYPCPSENVGASGPGRIRGLAGSILRSLATYNSSSLETSTRAGRFRPPAQLSSPLETRSCPSRRGPPVGPRLASRSPDLGGGVDPRDARRDAATGRLAQSPDDPPMVPSHRP